MAHAYVPKLSHCAKTRDDLALGALTADLACAMALSDLGFAPSVARRQAKSTPDEATSRWCQLVTTDPGYLFDCADVAESLASLILSELGGTERARSEPTERETRTDNVPPHELSRRDAPTGIAVPSTSRPHATVGTCLGYTLHETVAESERASTAMSAGTRNAEGGVRP